VADATLNILTHIFSHWREIRIVGDTAAKCLSELNIVLADCKKRLGKKGVLPKPRTDPATTLTKSAAMGKALDVEVKKFIKALKDYRTLLSDVEGDAVDFNTAVQKSEFKLSKANIDEEKIINKVRYDLNKCLSDIASGSKTPRSVATKMLAVLEGGDDLSTF
jgi:hypothetical protein